MEKLQAYVASGGRLVLNPTLPVLNSQMQPELFLSRAWNIGIERVRPLSEKNYYLHQNQMFAAENDMTLFRENPGLEVLWRNHEQKPCAVRRRVGRGEVTIIGFGLQHQFDYTLDHVQALAAKLGVVPAGRFVNSATSD